MEEASLLTEEQAAQRLHVTVRTLQKWCRARQIGFVRVTARVRAFREDDLTEFIERRHERPLPKRIDRSQVPRVSSPRKSEGNERGEPGEKAKTRDLVKEMRQWQ